MIAVRDLSFSYGAGAFQLNVPSLDIARGEKVAFIGPSGCGKTTLVSLICGVLKARRGSVHIDGDEMTALNDADRRALRIRRIGFVFQEFELLDYLRVRDNILLPFMLTNALTLTDEIRSAARKLADATGITDKLARFPSTLSQGEKQRVAICRALVTSPGLVVADEPTGNLDPRASGDILKLLVDQTQQHNATLLCVTHNHTLLDAFDRVIDVAAMQTEAVR